MDVLQNLMKKLLADTFALYLKAHNFHWNVEGADFAQYHDFFGDLYEEVYSAVDPTAEQIRTLDTYAPGSLSRFSELTDIEDEMMTPDAREMCRRLLVDNQKVLTTLNMTFKIANNFDKQGIVDFIAARIDAHEKHAWMLRSFSK
jgi:starvation-inducible DNA-binding protein